MNSMKNIVLIGFMGTGKTSTGKLLANKLDYAFIDMDSKIEAEEKMTIKDIFARYGEKYFRKKEATLVQQLAEKKNVVVSTGGGTVMNPENMIILQKMGIVVSLAAEIDIILERTGRRGTRPVLDYADVGDRRAAIENVLAMRAVVYQQADFIVDTSALSPMQVTEEIMRLIKKDVGIHA